MKLYQQIATGFNAIDSSRKLTSKILYRSKKEAEDAMDEFIKKVTTPIDEFDFSYLEEVHETSIVELELPDEEKKC